MRQLALRQDYPFPLCFRRSVRARRLRLTVKTAGVECVMPLACSEAQARAFIHRHRLWLLAKYREAVEKAPRLTFWQELAAGDEPMLPFQGRDMAFRIIGSPGARCRLYFADNAFHLHLPDRHREVWSALSERSLFSWGRSWLSEQAAQILDQHQRTASLQARRLRIKRMRSRWGSCGMRNDINLNWLLMFVPPSVLEYVVVHELCHTRHRDHSARFWALVAEHLPAYRRERQWLKTHGRSLMLRFGGVSR